MKKTSTKWFSGAPTTPGLYWFNSGLGTDSIFILQITTHSQYIFGNGGSMPLSMIYNEKLCKLAKWTHINQSNNWINGKKLTDKNNRAWIRHPEGYVGVILYRVGSHNNIGGTIVWLNNPTEASISGSWINNDEGYLYSLIKEPALK